MLQSSIKSQNPKFLHHPQFLKISLIKYKFFHLQVLQNNKNFKDIENS